MIFRPMNIVGRNAFHGDASAFAGGVAPADVDHGASSRAQKTNLNWVSTRASA